MIKNKSQFIKALKENKENIRIKRIYNFEEDNKIPTDSIGEVVYLQSNACRVKYDTLDRELWVYFDSYEIKDNKMYIYSGISNFNEERMQEELKKFKELGIELIPIGLDDKLNDSYNKGNSNYYYVYKFAYLINEIIEL